MKSIFISYRRSDTSGQTGRIYDRLAQQYGDDHVFQDVDAIGAGVDFVDAVEAAIATSDVALIVIGPDWNPSQEEETDGPGRLANRDDNVRLEVEAALAQPDLRVIPILVRGASMPTGKDLPESLRPLTRLNAVEIRDTSFDANVGRLLREIGRPRGRLLRRGLLAVGASGVAVVAAIATLSAESGPPPMKPSSFNIAVAEFRATDGQDPDEAAELSARLAESLIATFSEVTSTASDQPELNLAVAVPADIGPVDGTTREERARAARSLAEDINADVVLYGIYGAADGNTVVQPEFYVTERNLRGAEELTGHHELGSALAVPASISTGNQLAELEIGLRARTSALAEFAVGLFHYTFHDYETAAKHFDIARLTRDWEESQGKEVVDIFLGNSAAKLEDFEGAMTHYEHAASLNSEYARARLGLAEASFLRSGASCSESDPDYDAEGVRDALVQYESVLDAQDQPALSDISAKVALGRGRALLCLGLAAGSGHSDEAEALLRSVVVEYQNGKTRIAGLAAEAHALLGLMYYPAEDHPAADAAYRPAAAEYEEAIALTRDPARKATLYAALGEIWNSAGEADRAVAAYEQAIQLTTNDAARADYEGVLQTIRADGG